MEEVYIIIYDEDNLFVVSTDPEYVIGNLIEHGYGYDDMRIFKGREIDFTVDSTRAQVSIKEE